MDRSVRSLDYLDRSASTARVLNLLQIARENSHRYEWEMEPFFQTASLNHTLIIKHRLRRDEREIFHLPRQIGTKIILPLDRDDLKAGGRALFVNQKHFERMMVETFGIGDDHPDVRTLRLIDDLPSLDPFLLRERLRQADVRPGSCYFAITPADQLRMTRFVQDEIQPLVELSLGSGVGKEAALRLAAKIMSEEPGEQLDALRRTLGLTYENYEEGMFSWKGFLYYKWVLSSLMEEVVALRRAVATVKPPGKLSRVDAEYLARGRLVIGKRIVQTVAEVTRTLRIYEDAYAGLIKESRPTAFRDFLLEAPRLFARLGEQLGAVQHVTSFWKFRFGRGSAALSADELIDIFMDFETSLAERTDPSHELL